jgi:hypothetical protein
MLAALVIAVALIALVITRSVLWHAGGTPYDGVVFAGIIISVLYLLSFYAFERSPLTFIVLTLFGCYYLLMAFLVSSLHPRVSPIAHAAVHATHHGVAHQNIPASHVEPVDHAHDPVFRRGMKPVAEHAPPHHGPSSESIHASKAFHRGLAPIAPHAPPHHVPATKESSSRTSFKRGMEPIAEHAPPHHIPEKSSLIRRIFRKRVAPLQEMQPPRPARVHEQAFVKGMEPIHEITAEHLHKLGVYDLDEFENTLEKLVEKKPVRKRK